MKQPVCKGAHKVTDLETFPVRISRDEAPVRKGAHRVTDLGLIYVTW